LLANRLEDPAIWFTALGNGVDGLVNSITVWYTAPNGLGGPAV